MTDEEIELVLSYKVTQAVGSAELLARVAAETARAEQVIADNAASSQRALDLLQYIVEHQYPIAPVGTPTSVAPTTYTPTTIGT